MEQSRELKELADGWRFFPSDDLVGAEAPDFNDSAWKQVTMPHTWQTVANRTWLTHLNYSNCWYRKHFTVPAGDKGERIYLRFDGVGIMAEVFVNGIRLGRHVGAYSAFVYDATDAVKYGADNVLAVRCDNKKEIEGNLAKPTKNKERWFPYYHVAAGIYRPVWLFKTDPCHISPMDYGSSGVYVTESNLTNGGADLSIKTMLRNAGATPQEFALRHTVLDSEGKTVGVLEDRVKVAALSSADLTVKGRLASVVYWTPSDPRLYTVRTELRVGDRVRDVVTTRIGIRSLAMKDGEFVLNGQPIKLVGAALHAVSERNFHAVRNEETRRDMESVKEVGFNTVFLAHYPHPQYAYDLADELGLLVWAENGYVNGSYDPEVSAGITREMIRQYYNHPSIFCWSASNEPDKKNKEATKALLEVVRSEGDPRRLVTLNSVPALAFSPPQADFEAQSIFSGWYDDGASLWKEPFRYINQSGGGGLITHQAGYRERYHKISEFESEGYQQYLAEAFSKRVCEDHDYFLYLWWAMKDFGAGNYHDILNTKGLETFSGYRKDIYYLWQSCLRADINVLHLGGQHWFLRGNEGNAIKVYSNSKKLKLTVNGVDRGERWNGSNYRVDGRLIKNVFYWEHVLVPGRNDITVTDGKNSQSYVLYFAPDGKLPKEEASLVTDLQASNGPAWGINLSPDDQWPVYAQFDGKSDNTFDVIPDALRAEKGKAVTWIATRRQSDVKNTTDLSFKIAPTVKGQADVWLMTSKWAKPAEWIAKAGFKPTGITGQWRNEKTYLVDYELFKKEVKAGERVELHASSKPTDYVVFVTAKKE